MQKQFTDAKSNPKAKPAPKVVAKDLKPRRAGAVTGGEGSTANRAWDLQTTKRT